MEMNNFSLKPMYDSIYNASLTSYVTLDNLDPKYQFKNSFMFPFERDFDYGYRHTWMAKYWTICFAFIGVYLVFIHGVQALMKNRQPFQLRKALFVWNVSLAIFSTLGFLRTLPEFLYALSQFGFQYSVCVASFMLENQVGSFWTWAFVASKIPEFIDTVFIVLRKQKLIFLHWYHHIIVVIYAWYTYQQHTSMVRYFIMINFGVHSVMYSYFALRALQVKMPKWVSVLITSAQIMQMIIACVVSSSVYYFHKKGCECDVEVGTMYFALFMYFSFFVLFSKFFVDSYVNKVKDENTKTKKSC